MSEPKEVGRPATPAAKLNLPIPPGVRVERQESGGINSKNEAGGEIATSKYGGK
jgi:hypothetical protein